ncbi:hypothetical protein GGI15_001053 [Coemansia interrupta]|uniref:EamA domain-containing protein n=1 Tax=Coemansia interrupta TaxID=1126814 RepID=A0A9W8HKQ4_9FUNG|nr:hypothetical protein GGI15_001053 [Coemansia interrupta]
MADARLGTTGLHSRRHSQHQHQHHSQNRDITASSPLDGIEAIELEGGAEPMGQGSSGSAVQEVGLPRPSARSSMLLGASALFICILSFVGQTIVIRNVQESYVQPYFILWFSHSFWVIMLPLHVLYEKMKRRSRTLGMLRLETLVASAKLIVQRGYVASGDLETVDTVLPSEYHRVQTADLDDVDNTDGGSGSNGNGNGNGNGEQQSAAVFKVVDDEYEADDSDDGSRLLALRRPGWVLLRTFLLTALLAGLLNSSAYLWYVAVGFTSMSKVTAIYNMSCFFAYVFSIMLLHERIKLDKCVAVAISILGVVFMALADSGADAQNGLTQEQQASMRSNELFGDLLSLICAGGIGLYQVLYKKYAVPNDYHSLFHVNFMTTLLGLCTLVFYWVPIPALSISGVERFHWPNREQLAYILTNALFGVAYNGGFMIALALTSPLFAAIGVMLTIPVMAVVDMVIQGQVLAWNVFLGGGAILAGFCILTFAEYRDTVDKAKSASNSGDDSDDDGNGDDDNNSAAFAANNDATR